MSAPVILVTAVCGDLGSSAVRALYRERYHIIGADMRPYCPVAECLESFNVLPPARDEDYLPSLLALCEASNVKVVLPLSEPEIIFLNANREVFAERGIYLVLNSAQILNIFFDKYATIKHIASLGYKVPRTMLLDENLQELTMPYIIKPRSGCGSRGVSVVTDVPTRDYFTARHGATFIAQELVGNDEHEYTTGVFSDGTHIASITFRRILAKGGYSQEVHLVDDEYIRRLAKDIATSVNLKGSINIQTRKVGDQHIPFEINPRLSSTLMFRALAGFKDAHWWIQHLLYGNRFDYVPLDAPFVGVRHIVEKVFFN